MSPNTERMSGATAKPDGKAPVTGIPNEFKAIQAAFLARWHELGWAKETGQGAISYDDENDECVATITIEDRHLNPGGIAHGGVLFSVIDSLMGYIVFRSEKVPENIATQSQTIDFMRPPTGTVTCKARIDKRGKTSAYCSGEAYGEDGELLARSTSVWAIRPRNVEPAGTN